MSLRDEDLNGRVQELQYNGLERLGREPDHRDGFERTHLAQSYL
jgi:hypothetical protein